MYLKGFTTMLTAIAISFASFSATPVKADNDTAKIIAGVAALAIVGAAIADNRKDRRYVTRYHNQNYYNPYYGYPRKAYRQHYYKKHHRGHFHGHKHYKHKKYKHHRKHW